MDKFCVTFVFILLQLSFRATIEVSMFCAPFKNFFFPTSFLISSLGCHSRIPCFVSILFATWLKVESGCFYSICLGVFLKRFMISSLDCHGRKHCYLSIFFSNVTQSWKWLFFIPFGRVFFQLVLGQTLTFSLFHSQKSPIFPNCCSAFLYVVL